MTQSRRIVKGQASELRGDSLLERDGVGASIVAALRGVEAGNGAVVFLAGPAGIGKTSSLGWAERAARGAEFRVARATGTPMETGLPFGLLGQAIVALGGSVVEDVEELARLGGQSARFYRTLRWLSEVAATGPLLLALDDLHWADPDSLELIGFLCRRLAGSRILVVGTLRPEPDAASALAHELAASGHARLMTLEPLSRGASETLVERVVERPLAAAEGEWLARACAGTPLLLEAAARRLTAGGTLPALARNGRLGRELLLERFAGVGDDAYRYVEAASIFGVRFQPALVAVLAGLDRDTADGAHARLVRARLLDDLGGGWAGFVHPLFAQALLETQPLAVRERLHARVFRLLVDEGASDAVAAEHAVAARLVGDPLAVEVAARAGRAALAQGALEAASAQLASAVELAGEIAPDDLLLDHASALVARAQIEEAGRVCARLLERAELDPAVRTHALRLLARAALVAGRPAEAERLYEQAVSAAALEGPAAEAAALADAALTCQIGSPVSWVLATTSRALAILPPGLPARRTLEVIEAYASLLGGDPSGAGLIAGETRRWSDRAGGSDHGWAWTLAVHSLNAFKCLEDLAGATELFEREFERAVEDGAPILMNALAIAYADAVHRLGRPQEAFELVERAAAVSAWPMAPWSDLARAVLLTDLGRNDEARPCVEAIRAFQAGIPPQYNAPVSLWLDLLDARRLLAAGEPDRASETMLHAAGIARLTGWREPCVVPWAGVGLDAHFAAGRIERARELVDELDELARPLPCRWPRAVLALGRARLAAAEGRLDEADRGFADALGAFGELPMPIAHAEALVAQGIHLRGSGRPREAREPLAQALGLAERSGSERVARSARAELAASGGRRRRDADRSRLTPQEERVAALAADGLTNAQIAAALHLSPKTVGHHLQHVYGKLGIGSRRELIRRRRELA
ncbi:MAG TPA: AAA family ATPase [Gaiellaceae bacterium]|nr:AAA family ATPase [Gaiellaceae bacterium]